VESVLPVGLAVSIASRSARLYGRFASLTVGSTSLSDSR
jgi:hypothetical protein